MNTLTRGKGLDYKSEIKFKRNTALHKGISKNLIFHLLTPTPLCEQRGKKVVFRDALKIIVIFFIVFGLLKVSNSYGQFTVSGSNGKDGTYSTLTLAGGVFSSLNGASQSGKTITITISGNSTDETGTITLTASPVSLTIEPGSATLFTISGTTLFNATPLINISGVSNVTINGNYGGAGQYLLFRNTNPTAGNTGPVIQFTGTVSNELIENCIIESNATTVSAGAVTVGSAGANILIITGCNIHDATGGNIGPVSTAIYSNNAINIITVQNNNISNFLNYGVNFASVAAGSKVTGNFFYFNYNSGTATTRQTIINIAGGANAGNYSITDNYIGGQSATAGGSAWTNSSNSVFTGINVTGATGNNNFPSEIYNNTIQNITLTGGAGTGFTGINTSGYINTGYNKTGVSQTGNTIGGNYEIQLTGASDAAVYGIYSSSNSTFNSFIGNNTVSNISTGATSLSSFTGIYSSMSGGNTVTTSFENNTIQTITMSGTGSESFTGITVSGSNIYKIGDINANTIGANSTSPYSITNAGTGNTTGFSVSTSASGNIITGNFIEGIKTTAASNFTGIVVNVSTSEASEITSNTISSIYQTLSGTYTFWGINVSAGLVNVGTKIDGLTGLGNKIGGDTIGSITFGGTNDSYGILVTSSASGLVISNNTVKGIKYINTTGNSFHGIWTSLGSASPSEITNNMIGLMSFAGGAGLKGIRSQAGLTYIGVKKDGVTAAGNTIGGSPANAITFTSFNSGANTFCIYVENGAAANSYISNNTMSYITIPANGGIALYFWGILANLNGGNAYTTYFDNNKIQNITQGSTGAFTGFVIGQSQASNVIKIGANQPNYIGDNTPNNIINTNTGAIQCIILNTSAGGNVINGNYIEGIQSTANSNYVYGIWVQNAGSTSPSSITANTIQLIDLATSTTSQTFCGINVNAGKIYVGVKSDSITLAGNTIGSTSSPTGIINASSGTTTGITINTSASGSIVAGNTIQNITSTHSTASTNVYGVNINGGATNFVYKNNINNLTTSGSGGGASAYGFYVNGGTTNHLYNNFISNIAAPATTNGNAVAGIYLNGGTTNNIFYNTIYLNASSTGTTFGSSGIYSSTNPKLTLANNIIINNSVPGSKSGYTAALRFNNSTLSNYTTASNNNNYYAGNHGPQNVIFYDGTPYECLPSFQTLVGPIRDSASITENTIFQAPSTPGYFDISTGTPTLCESHGIPIAKPTYSIAITDDFHGNKRWGESGYTGTGTATDIGANEDNFIKGKDTISEKAIATATKSLLCTGDSTTIILTGYTGTIQWQQSTDGTNWGNVTGGSGSTTRTYTTPKLTTTTLYMAQLAKNACINSSFSTVAIVTIISPPISNTVFVKQIKNPGDSVSYTLSPGGTGPFTYQWLKNGKNIQGATNSIYNIKTITCADTGTYTCSMGNKCDTIIVKVAQLYVNCSRYWHAISGYVRYENKDSTAMTNTNVYITNASNQIVGNTTTDAKGNYVFTNLINGIYKLTCSTTKAWGGSNPVDALMVNRSYIGLYNITDPLKLLAANVNGDKKINPVDALMINRRYIGLLNKFVISDWVFSNPTITINGTDTMKNIYTLCAGDVNGSYVPPARIMNYELGIRNDKEIKLRATSNQQTVDIPVYYSSQSTDDRPQLGAMGVKFKVQGYSNPNPSPFGEGSSNFKVVGVKSDLEGLIYNVTEDGVNIAWTAELEGYSVNPDKPLFVLSCQLSVISKSDNPISNNLISITSESVLADIEGNKIGTDRMQIPRLQITDNRFTDLNLSCYPNPFNESAILSYNLSDDGFVSLKIYDLLGKKIATLADRIQKAGNYTYHFDDSNLKPGIYYCKIETKNSSETYKLSVVH